MRSIIARSRHLPLYAAGRLDCVDGAATQNKNGKRGLRVAHWQADGTGFWKLNARNYVRVWSLAYASVSNRARRQSGFPTFISCQRQDANVLPKRRQSHQGDKLCDVSTVPLVARWPVFLARGSDADGEPHWLCRLYSANRSRPVRKRL